eukprot:TRINITY_DN55413_c0_g1_i1.p1 TRINITY_DN55413_c0_g1~~TRINITY_DN55413_c0_g1_i1.p1  ORF type:complete len:397 (+),score=84.90 TRINITY_DN55413_c0_g1_i1:49-1191(+)
MLWSTVLLALILILFSVLAVEVIQPLAADVFEEGHECHRCAFAFSTVWSAGITLFQQIVAGDSWGLVTIPILEKYPASILFFVPVLVIIQFGILNLVLVAIVDQAQKAGENDAMLQAQLRLEAYQEAQKNLIEICQSMDHDGSGDLDIEELTEAFHSNPELANYLKFLDVKLEDVEILFHALDSDGSGSVRHQEFVDQLFKMQNQDTGVMLSFVKSYVQDMRQKQADQMVKSKEQADALSQLSNSVNEIKKALSGHPGALRLRDASKAEGETDSASTSAGSEPWQPTQWQEIATHPPSKAPARPAALQAGEDSNIEALLHGLALQFSRLEENQNRMLRAQLDQEVGKSNFAPRSKPQPMYSGMEFAGDDDSPIVGTISST